MDARCLICLELLNPMEISALRCGHTFHHGCIRMWLVNQHKNICPTCREPAQASHIIQQLQFRLMNNNGTTTAAQCLENLEYSVQTCQQQLMNIQSTNHGSDQRVENKAAEIVALKASIALSQNEQQDETTTTFDSLMTEVSTKKDENQVPKDDAKRLDEEGQKLEKKIMNLPADKTEFDTRSEALKKGITDQKKANNNLKRELTAQIRDAERMRTRRLSNASSSSGASGNAVDPSRYEWKY